MQSRNRTAIRPGGRWHEAPPRGWERPAAGRTAIRRTGREAMTVPPATASMNACDALLGPTLAGGRGQTPALIFHDTAITYAELEKLVNRFGNALRLERRRPGRPRAADAQGFARIRRRLSRGDQGGRRRRHREQPQRGEGCPLHHRRQRMPGDAHRPRLRRNARRARWPKALPGRPCWWSAAPGEPVCARHRPRGFPAQSAGPARQRADVAR